MIIFLYLLLPLNQSEEFISDRTIEQISLIITQ